MPKSSTVTSRATPVSGAKASAGGLQVVAQTITLSTTERIELKDVTEEVMSFARASGVREGTISVCSLHTTCAVLINEAQRALHADIKRFLDRAVARDDAWLHNDPEHSDCDRMNADSHLRAMLLGHSLTLQIAGGELVLGQWQRLIVAELDGPRERTLRMQIMGIA
jgi:secondary thiamine-phosphate synthase enzyme